MKKALFLLIVLTLTLTSCSDKKSTETDTTASTSNHIIADSLDTSYAVTDNEISGDVFTNSNHDDNIGGGEIKQEKYRQCYYNIPYQFTLLADTTEVLEWEYEVYAEDPNVTNEMVIKRFVQDFNIPREDFDRANLELAKALSDSDSPGVIINPKDYVNQEMFEIFNADIIYTFDDEIINNYYLSGEYPFVYESDYETAVENGTYVSQTEVWVDVEAMEAEIIEKYGETEIVTEYATEIQE